MASHSWKQFIYYVFQDASSKGSLYQIVIGSQIDIITSKPCMLIAIVGILVMKSLRKIGLDEVIQKKISGFCIGLFVFMAGLSYGNSIWEALCNAIKYKYFYIILAIFIIGGVTHRISNTIANTMYVLSLVCVAFLLILNVYGETTSIYSYTLFSLITEIITLIYVYLLLWLLFTFFERILFKRRKSITDICVACGGVAAAYATAMATGGTNVSTICSFICVPAIFFINIEKQETNNISDNSKIDYLPKVLTLKLIVLVVFCICLSQKLICAYSWWGDTEASYWEKTEESEIECLKGFKFSKEEIKKYDGLANIIEYYTDDNSTIMGFPYTVVYNILTANYNQASFCPILFYDTCPDDVAQIAAATFEKTNPDIVVWQDIPSCMETHEQIFREKGSLCGQRYIQFWFSTVKDSNYTLIGQVEDIYVYKRNNEQPVDKTYIERKTKTNQTAIYDGALDNKTVALELKGTGTMENPYQISNEEELSYFRNLVNAGRNFSGEYVELTADIDLSKFDYWEPIGIYNSGNIFSGVFNGNGYSITNLTIDDAQSNNGLFGQLSGTVENLEITNFYIKGKTVGAIAAEGYSNSIIVNCVVQGTLIGEAGGGITNGNTELINCIAYVNLDGDRLEGISGNVTNSINHCYSNVADGINIDAGQIINDEVVDALNQNVGNISERFGNRLLMWEFQSDRLTLRHLI